MAAMTALHSHPLTAGLLSAECVALGTTVCGLFVSISNTTGSFNGKARSLCNVDCCVIEPYTVNNFRRAAWRIHVNGSSLNPSPLDGNNGGTRLFRAIRALQISLGAKTEQVRKNLPMKLLFFLVGFYCATAFATVIGQTGDWDILSAALAVVVVEGIGALMYKSSFPVFSKIKGLISMFNYWKAGLSLGLFLDSFKY